MAGGVGSLSSLGRRGLELQEKFFGRLGLRPADITWNTARDVIVEWFQLLTLVSGTADKIGHEVYNLQRPEIGEVTEGFVLSESVMLALAESLGKQTAHTLVYETAMKAHETGRPLKDAILENAEIRKHLSVEKIESLFDYRRHTGLCGEMVDRVVVAGNVRS